MSYVRAERESFVDYCFTPYEHIIIKIRNVIKLVFCQRIHQTKQSFMMEFIHLMMEFIHLMMKFIHQLLDPL